ncbi:7169_t:CDS:2, partial [Cetraspora pellucida]
FIENSEYKYKSVNDNNIFDDKTTNYVSKSFDRNSNHNSDNIDTFTLDKMSFENARIFAKNDEISYDTFWKNNNGLKNDSIFLTELKLMSTITHNKNIILEDLLFVFTFKILEKIGEQLGVTIWSSQSLIC